MRSFVLRIYYKKDEFGIWYDGDSWMIGFVSYKGEEKGFAYITIDIPFPDSTTNWRWSWFLTCSPDLTMANKGLGVKGIPIFFTNR